LLSEGKLFQSVEKLILANNLFEACSLAGSVMAKMYNKLENLSEFFPLTDLIQSVSLVKLPQESKQ